MKITRKTRETEIEIEIVAGEARIDTPVAFLNHMLNTFSKHSGIGLAVQARSLDGDEHHLVEDVALALGQALGRMAASEPRERFGEALIPMDDALVLCALDTGGRPFYEGTLPRTMDEHFLRSLAFEARFTVHIDVRRGKDEHHVVEAAYKALARALRQALRPASTIQSVKGEVRRSGG